MVQIGSGIHCITMLQPNYMYRVLLMSFRKILEEVSIAAIRHVVPWLHKLVKIQPIVQFAKMLRSSLDKGIGFGYERTDCDGGGAGGGGFNNEKEDGQMKQMVKEKFVNKGE